MAENRDYENGESHADEANFTSVDEIERLTGLDFLSDLDDEVEAALDVRKTTTIWFFDSDPVRSGSTSNHRDRPHFMLRSRGMAQDSAIRLAFWMPKGGVTPMLVPGGAVAVELAPEQAPQVADWFRAAGLGEVRTHEDLSRRPRVVSARKPAAAGGPAEG